MSHARASGRDRVLAAWDWFLCSDPDLGRARTAARATLTTAISALLLWLLGQATGHPLRPALPAITLALMTTVTVTDATLRAQKLTFLLAPLVSLSGVAGGALLARNGLLSRAAFLVLIFLAVRARSLGPRGVALGTVGYLAYFSALMFRLAPRDLLWTMSGIAVAGAVAYGVRFLVLADDEAKLLARSVTVLRRAVSLSLTTLARFAQDGPWGEPERARVRRSLERLNEVALMVDDHVAPTDGNGALSEARAAVLQLELETGRAAALARGAVTRGLIPESRHALAAALRAAAAAVRSGRANPRPDLSGVDSVLEQTLTDLVVWARRLPSIAGRGAARDPNRAPASAPPAGKADPNTRLAVRATVACGLAIVVGELISPLRWYWAVIGAFVMFIRAETLGATLRRGWHRVIGTAVGVVIGRYVVGLVIGHEAVELVMMFVCIFAAYYFLRVVYGFMVLAITLVVADLYGMLGVFTPAVLYLRLAETLAGCAVGALVAMLVLPAPTTPRLRQALADLLRTLADLLEQVAQAGPTEAFRLAVQVRALDQKLRALEELARPLTGTLIRQAAPTPARQVHFAQAAVASARRLAIAVDAADEETRRHLHSAAPPVAARVRALAAWLGGEQGHPGSDGSLPQEELSAPEGTPLYWLARLSDAERALREA